MRRVRAIRSCACMHKGDGLLRALEVTVDERNGPGGLVADHGALVTETLLFICSQRSRGRYRRVLVLVLCLSARCQVLFEGIHVRRQFRNLAEDESEVHVQEGRE